MEGGACHGSCGRQPHVGTRARGAGAAVEDGGHCVHGPSGPRRDDVGCHGESARRGRGRNCDRIRGGGGARGDRRRQQRQQRHHRRRGRPRRRGTVVAHAARAPSRGVRGRAGAPRSACRDLDRAGPAAGLGRVRVLRAAACPVGPRSCRRGPTPREHRPARGDRRDGGCARHRARYGRGRAPLGHGERADAAAHRAQRTGTGVGAHGTPPLRRRGRRDLPPRDDVRAAAPRAPGAGCSRRLLRRQPPPAVHRAVRGAQRLAAEGSPQIFGESAFRGKKAAGRPYAAA